MIIEIDGPDVTPRTVDPAELIGLAHHYLAALRRVAADEGIAVTFRGVEIVPKCAGVKIAVADEQAVRDAADATERARAKPGAAHMEHFAALAKHVRRLRPGHHASVHLPSIAWVMRLEPLPSAERPILREQTTRRVRIIGVAGESPAKVRVYDYQTDTRFGLVASREIAVAAGRLIFEDASMRLVLERDRDSLKILGGSITTMEHAPRGWKVDEVVEWWKKTFQGGDS